jgi:spermidine/putrescine transport system substrate-binding protein
MRFFLLVMFVGSFLFANSLRVSNFADYIDIEVLKDFASKNGIEIIYDTHSYNEDIYNKLLNNSDFYDVAFLTSNYIEKLKKQNLITEIEKDKLANYKNIDQKLLEVNFKDTKNYLVPYFWGSIGLYINQKKTNKNFYSWNDLWSTDLKKSILISKEPLDVFAITLKSLGYSANTTNEEEIKKAYEKLLLLIPNIKKISSGNAPTYFVQNDFIAGMMFNGDAKTITEDVKEYKYIYPKEGVLLWADGMVIPTNSKNKELAYKFIDFIIDAKVSVQIADKIGYALANAEAKKYMPKSYLNDYTIYPSVNQMKNSEILNDNENSNKLILEYWQKFLSEFDKYQGK